MAIASRLKWFLDVNQAEYDLQAGEVPDEQRFVPELFQDARGYLMVVHPASREIGLSELRERTGRALHPVRERALRDIFFDCQKGAIPPLGPAYGVPTLVEGKLPDDGDVYFRGGDAKDWVHMRGTAFRDLVMELVPGSA